MLTPSSSAASWRVRILLPEIWAESLQYLLQEEGFGIALAEVRYPSGSLEGDPVVARLATIRLRIDAPARERLEPQLRQWMADWGLKQEDWQCQLRESGAADAGPLAWQSQWKPFRCAGFVIYPDFLSWENLETRAEDRPLRILAGSAFGSGGHVTTRHGLHALRWLQVGGHPMRRILDVGAGSGILAVAAALEGATCAVGMDPDPQSPKQATRMAASNGVGDRCAFWRGTLDSSWGRFDLVFANLVAELLIAEAGTLAARLAKGGSLFTGGVLASKRPQVIEALEAAGLEATGSGAAWRQRGAWCADIWSHR